MNWHSVRALINTVVQPLFQHYVFPKISLSFSLCNGKAPFLFSLQWRGVITVQPRFRCIPNFISNHWFSAIPRRRKMSCDIINGSLEMFCAPVKHSLNPRFSSFFFTFIIKNHQETQNSHQETKNYLFYGYLWLKEKRKNRRWW